MTMHDLVSAVHARTGTARDLILLRARSNWPTVVDFKDVQVELLASALIREKHPHSPTRAVSIGGVSRPARFMVQ